VEDVERHHPHRHRAERGQKRDLEAVQAAQP
jgi:hypothetical protein